MAFYHEIISLKTHLHLKILRTPLGHFWSVLSLRLTRLKLKDVSQKFRYSEFFLKM